MTIHIITDGSSDLTPELASKFGIHIVPLNVQFGDDMYTSDMESKLFYQRMKEESELPKTSSPSPAAFYNMFKSLDADKDIFVLCLSATLSSTYNHALMAKEMYEEEGHPNKVEVIDAKTTSIGLGLLAVRATIMAKAGESLQELNDKMKQLAKQTNTFFSLDTLENVIRGGRLSRLKGSVASMLNIKLVMRAADDGSVEMIEKVRGTQRAVKRLIEKVEEAWQHHADREWIAFAHSNCEERAREFMNMIQESYPFKNVLLVNMGAVIGTYAGEGGLLVTFSQSDAATNE
ncbi:DegV family protein [Paenibacillus arenosi]|uniref:DegV family protein n=1 Tax=Paenibacillus arenosi TaxID=2774142 RepID=A0ABR9AUV8_9BACL|nr:DegV family protein [Paenibacillus arenosi]MBD8497802.1 DegV family protein [Paenibacillus arenosi]